MESRLEYDFGEKGFTWDSPEDRTLRDAVIYRSGVDRVVELVELSMEEWWVTVG